MHAHAWTAVTVAGALAWAAIPHADILVTLPQADSWRFSTSPATASVSADGRYVALSSYARLVPADTDAQADIYVLDRISGAVTLESVAVDDRPLIGDSSHPRLSGDGRYLVFDTVVVTVDGRLDTDIVVRDRVRNTATYVSHDRPPGRAASRHPAISEDGHVVVFASAGTTLVDGSDENGPSEDVYAFDTTTRAHHPCQRRQPQSSTVYRGQLLTRGQRRRTIRGVHVNGQPRRQRPPCGRWRACQSPGAGLRPRHAARHHHTGKRGDNRHAGAGSERSSGDQR